MEIIQSGKYSIRIFYEDNHLLVVEKPVNMPTQADDSGDPDLLTALKEYIGRKYNKPGAVYLGLVHRLDRPVGGVMVFARTSKAASRLSEAFRTHEQDRQYLAVCEGVLPAEAEWKDYLRKDPATGMVRVVGKDADGAKEARLITSPLCSRENLTLTRVRLFTGRSHQIRVQHMHAGHPLWGDIRYGHGQPGKQIALWAYEIRFEHPVRHEEMRFVSLPPENGIWVKFRDVLRTLDDGERG